MSTDPKSYRLQSGVAVAKMVVACAISVVVDIVLCGQRGIRRQGKRRLGA